MTAADLKLIYDRSQAQADAEKVAYHAALIAESPFQVGDRVKVPHFANGTITWLLVAKYSELVTAQVSINGVNSWHRVDSLTRID